MSIRNLFIAVMVAALTSSVLFSEAHRVTPEGYYTTFSASHAPITHLHPGDTGGYQVPRFPWS